MVRVALDLRVEEVDSALLRPQQLVGVVEPLAGFGDLAVRVVVELLVLMPRDDVSRLQGMIPFSSIFKLVGTRLARPSAFG